MTHLAHRKQIDLAMMAASQHFSNFEVMPVHGNLQHMHQLAKCRCCMFTMVNLWRAYTLAEPSPAAAGGMHASCPSCRLLSEIH